MILQLIRTPAAHTIRISSFTPNNLIRDFNLVMTNEPVSHLLTMYREFCSLHNGISPPFWR